MAVAIGKSSGVVRQLVMMFGVNKRDEYNRTPLMFAALGNNKSSSCSTLIDCGAEIDRQDICGLTALHVACYHGNKAAASVLLNRKASVCVFDNTVSVMCYVCVCMRMCTCIILCVHMRVCTYVTSII
jgi:hypothetical protein